MKNVKSDIKERRGVQSIEVGLRIVQAIASQRKALPLKTISALTQMAPSNVHKYLASFIRAGLLKQCPDSSRYDLGWFALEIGLSALSRLDVMDIAPPVLKGLVEEFGLLGIITVYGEQGPTIVRLQQPSPPITISLAIGSVIPVLRSATGKIYLAYLPEEMTNHIIQREFQANTAYPIAPSTPRTMADVRKLAEKVRSQFYASAEVDVSPGMYAIAAPVLGVQGYAVATMSLIGAHGQLSGDHPALHALIHACKKLSKEMGYQGE